MSFRASAAQAAKSQHKQHKLGAVIVKGGRILATGFNAMRPSALLKTQTLHAEAAAVLKLLKEKRMHDLAGSEMYVSRFTKGGRVGLAKPCVHCEQLIRAVGIKRVWYTTSSGTTSSFKI